ncbi:hypothetical protein C5749_05635 [Sphingobacterium gobiense]|uniref:HNH endonuclease n=1 Tax=Sphingobacterium gobiense TaxID=1382456 RepID=A0A2S9JTY5_9SPHI|nr:hypothetical protein C5749_05635 [Sphingobacterium gobiense]
MSRNKLVELRKAIRSNIKTVIDYISLNHIFRGNNISTYVPATTICMFCGSCSNNITKEHVIPRWIFEKDPHKFFDITLNGQSQTYNKTTVPACQRCNGELLSSLEYYVKELFRTVDLDNNRFSVDELQNLIRWLEIIDYKFQIVNITKKFLSPKNGQHIPYLKDFPLYMLLPNRNYSPSQVKSNIRQALRRISIKNKQRHLNSLVVFKTSNRGFHFFHTINDFIFLELPQFGIALFYFYIKTFEDENDCHKEAMKIIDEVY